MERRTVNFLAIAVWPAMLAIAWNMRNAWGFLAVALCLVGFSLCVGKLVTTRWTGALINERNLMSLSRFQTILWTVIVLSAYWMIAIAHIRDVGPDASKLAEAKKITIAEALDITIDKQLWLLMGISVTALIGTPLINGTKTQKNPDPAEVEKTAKAMSATGNIPASITAAANQKAATAAAAAATMPRIQALAQAQKDEAIKQAETEAKKEEVKDAIANNKQGTLYSNPSINDAAFSDMFEGEEVGNAAYLDIPKVQMFYFTVVVAFSYIVLLWGTMGQLSEHAADVKALPPLSDGMIALLGISHAANLAGKGVDRTKQQ